jgi:thioredoxin reductase (NADPH)
METDVLIVGAGPVGLEVAAAMQSIGLHAEVVDAGVVGQTIVEQFPSTTRFFSSPERLEIAGLAMPLDTQEKPTGEAYVAYLRSVIQSLSLNVWTFERVIGCHGEAGAFEVETVNAVGRHRTWNAKYVVLATGGTQRSRTLDVEGEDLPHVSRLLGNPHRFFQRNVLVVGGRNSAIESALRIFRIGGRAWLSYRGKMVSERVKYWLRPEVEALIAEGDIIGCLGTVVQRITPEHVELRHLDSNKTELIVVDDVLLQLGFEQDASTLELFGIDVNSETQQPTVDHNTMASTVPGVFVAGTATAGTQQRFKVYIETSHIHADRIAAAISGGDVPETPTPHLLPEG